MTQPIEDPPSIFEKLTVYLGQDIDESWGDAVLIFSSLITGVIDSTVYNVFTCFVSMQTGNTIYVGLGIAGQPESAPMRWAKALNAILCFSIGSLCFARAGRWMGPLKRSTMVLSWLFQALLVYVSALLIISGLVPAETADDSAPFNSIVLLPLGLLSFGSAGQIVQSRVLQHNEIPSVVLTSTYCDLMLDSDLFKLPIGSNPKRNRRFLTVIFLLAGAAIGGFLSRGGGIDNALWIAGSAKVLCAIAWLFWKSKNPIRLD